MFFDRAIKEMIWSTGVGKISKGMKNIGIEFARECGNRSRVRFSNVTFSKESQQIVHMTFIALCEDWLYTDGLLA